jgi:cysteine dioxygenase
MANQFTSEQIDYPRFSDTQFDSQQAPVIRNLKQLKKHISGVESPMSLSEIMGLLERVQLENPDIASEFESDDDNYCRKILFEDANSLLVAITWLPGQHSPIHNHNGSACGVIVVEGTATETKYLSIGDDKAIQHGGLTSYEVSDLFGGEGSEDLHVLGNRGVKPLRTLHLYSPPLHRERMQLFDEVSQATAKSEI